MAAEAAVPPQNEPIQPGGCTDLEAPGSPSTWIPTAPSNWRSSASAGVLGLALAGPAGGFLGVVNSVLTGPEAMQLESGTMLGQATQYTVATGLVVACVAGGHILLATAGVAGFGLNAAQQYMTEPDAECNREGQVEEGQANEAQDDESVASTLPDDLSDDMTEDAPEPKRFGWLASLPCFAGCVGWMYPAPEPVPISDVELEEQNKRLIQRSRHNLRHRLEHGSDSGETPSFLLFETTNLPPPKIKRRCDAKLHPVAHLPLNEGKAVVNDSFTGHVLMMHRPTELGEHAPYSDYFSKKTRRWELRLQGRFHRRPNGKLYMGVVLRDFDYSLPLSFFTSWLSTLSIAPLEYVVGSKVTLSFGDREQAALKEDALMAQVVSGLQAFDQIIVSHGEKAPQIDGDLDGLGITRKGAGSSSSWSSAVEEIEAGIQPDKVYTLCFWSASRFLDLMGGALTDLLPLLPAIPLSSFLDQWPPHFVFYTLDDKDAPGAQTEVPQLEQNKTYILDLMMLSKSNANLHLSKRYYFPEG